MTCGSMCIYYNINYHSHHVCRFLKQSTLYGNVREPTKSGFLSLKVMVLGPSSRRFEQLGLWPPALGLQGTMQKSHVSSPAFPRRSSLRFIVGYDCLGLIWDLRNFFISTYTGPKDLKNHRINVLRLLLSMTHIPRSTQLKPWQPKRGPYRPSLDPGLHQPRQSRYHT